MCFRNSPIFQQLLDDPTGGKRFHDGTSSSFSGGGGVDGMTMSKGDLEEQVEEYNDEKEEKKEKRKKQKDPSVKEVREHLRMIIQYHEREMEKSLPSIYPVLGPCGEDSENENGSSNGNSSGNGGKEGRVFKPVTSEIPKKKRKKASVSSIKKGGGVKRKKSTISGTKKKK